MKRLPLRTFKRITSEGYQNINSDLGKVHFKAMSTVIVQIYRLNYQCKIQMISILFLFLTETPINYID